MEENADKLQEGCACAGAALKKLLIAIYSAVSTERLQKALSDLFI